MAEPDYIAAHKHSIDHRGEIEASEICGCFHCRKIFPPPEIEEWTDDGGTALCPNCGIDSVIGSRSGNRITMRLLREMHRKWF